MKRLLCGLVALGLLVGGAGEAKADIIFNNFGPGDSYGPSGVDLNNNYSLMGQTYTEIVGCAFTPARDYYLDSVKLAAVALPPYAGIPGLDVLLMSDKNGVPGAVIESIHIADASGYFGSKPFVASSALRPVLDANTQYWIVASLTDPGTEGAWWVPINFDQGPAALNIGTSWIPVGDGTRLAFSVSATPVPEPSTLLLLAIGMLGVIGWAWRRPVQTATA